MNLPYIDGAGYEDVTGNKKETCVIVFSKESCKVCTKLEPIIVKIAGDYENSDQLKFYTMNVMEEASKKVFKDLKLVGVPQTAFFKAGEFQEALPGALDESILRREIDELLNPKKSFGAKLKNFFK